MLRKITIKTFHQKRVESYKVVKECFPGVKIRFQVIFFRLDPEWMIEYYIIYELFIIEKNLYFLSKDSVPAYFFRSGSIFFSGPRFFFLYVESGSVARTLHTGEYFPDFSDCNDPDRNMFVKIVSGFEVWIQSPCTEEGRKEKSLRKIKGVHVNSIIW